MGAKTAMAHRTILIGGLIGVAALSACGRPAKPSAATQHSSAAATAGGMGNVGWATYNMNYVGDRSSPLTEITAANVQGLRPVCRVKLGEEGSFHSGPVVIGDTLLITTVHTTVALNATTCATIWRFVDQPQKADVNPVNRGVAYLDGRIFRGTADGRLMALSSDSGRVLWDIQAGNPDVGEFLSSAPVAWHGLVFIGLAGSDWGVRGRVMAFDAKSGQEKWRFWTVPTGKERGAETWTIPATAAHGGGGTWSSYTLDTLANEIFVPVGNPAPDWEPRSRPGDNLFTNSVVVLDAGSGALKWWYQLTPNDGFDLYLGAAPMLYSTAGGDARVALASKDGHLYSIDRGTHKLAFKTAVTTVKAEAAKPTKAGIHACPGSNGGTEWNGPAFDAATQTIFVGAVDWCGIFKSGPPKFVPGGMYFGTLFMSTATDTASGWLTALDAGHGTVRWKFHAPAPIVAGVTHTAGGLVLTGDLKGNLYAFDQATGKVAYHTNLGGSVAGGVMTYAVGGKQYVAATAGNVGRMTFGALGSPTLVVLALGPAGQAAAGDSASEAQLALPPVTVGHLLPGTAAAVAAVDSLKQSGATPPVSTAAGAQVFQICAACHGAHGEGGAGANLQTSKKDLAGVTAYIKNPTGSMPHLYPSALNDDQVTAVAAYVMTFRH
jgi:alcohol dehydrogenase (cytochrome c)